MEAQTKKVSVIIPVYNAEKYIRKTLDSVLAQSFRNREILLVKMAVRIKAQRFSGNIKKNTTK